MCCKLHRDTLPSKPPPGALLVLGLGGVTSTTPQTSPASRRGVGWAQTMGAWKAHACGVHEKCMHVGCMALTDFLKHQGPEHRLVSVPRHIHVYSALMFLLDMSLPTYNIPENACPRALHPSPFPVASAPPSKTKPAPPPQQQP